MEVPLSLDMTTRKLFRVLAYASLLVMSIVLGYGLVSSLLQGVTVVGQNFVNAEFPSPKSSPIYFKPITYLYISALIFMYTELELNREKIRELPDWVINVSKIFAFTLAVVFFFELAYNLVFWSGELAAQAIIGRLNPDIIANPFPSGNHPWNVVFASKLWSLFLISGTYVFYFLTRIQDSKRVLVPRSINP